MTPKIAIPANLANDRKKRIAYLHALEAEVCDEPKLTDAATFTYDRLSEALL